MFADFGGEAEEGVVVDVFLAGLGIGVLVFGVGEDAGRDVSNLF